MSNFKKIFTLLNAKQFLRSKNYLTGISLIIIAGLVIGGVFYFKMESQKAKGAISTEGLVLWLKMDDNAGTTDVADSSVENHTCTAQQNTSVLSEVSLHQRALTFNGSSDYINCGNDPSLDITDAISISAWVYRVGSGINWQTIVDKSRASKNNGGYGIAMNTEDKVFVYLSSGASSYSSFTTTAVLPANQWVHVVSVREGSGNVDSGDIKIYFNGVIQDGTESGFGVPLGSNNFDVFIGTYTTTSGLGRWNGSIDGVKIYNRALSAEEIALHYFLGSETRLKNAVIKNAIIK